MESLKELTDLFRLEELASQFKIILLDTCALDPGKERKYAKREKAHMKLKTKYVLTLREYLRQELPIYMTPGTAKEHKEGLEGWLKNKKRRYSDNKGDKGIGSTIRLYTEKRKFLDLLNQKKRIIRLNEDEQEGQMEIYEKTPQLASRYQLSSVDLDYVLTGAVLSESRDSCALLSNDMGILHATREIKGIFGLDEDRFAFYSNWANGLPERLD